MRQDRQKDTSRCQCDLITVLFFHGRSSKIHMRQQNETFDMPPGSVWLTSASSNIVASEKALIGAPWKPVSTCFHAALRLPSGSIINILQIPRKCQNKIVSSTEVFLGNECNDTTLSSTKVSACCKQIAKRNPYCHGPIKAQRQVQLNSSWEGHMT